MSLINTLFDYIAMIKHLDDSESIVRRPLCGFSIVSHYEERQDLGLYAEWQIEGHCHDIYKPRLAVQSRLNTHK